MRGYWPALALRFILLLLLLLGYRVGSGQSCGIDPLAPIGWVVSGIKTGVSATVTTVKTAAKGVQGAYRLANPTEPPYVFVKATASEPPKSGYRPMGCYADKDGKPDLPFEGGTGLRMNKDKCSSKCQLFGVAYFGLQTSPKEKGALICWCGNFYGLYGQGTKYDCQNRCPGEEGQSMELCGGEFFNSVYEIKKKKG